MNFPNKLFSSGFSDLIAESVVPSKQRAPILNKQGNDLINGIFLREQSLEMPLQQPEIQKKMTNLVDEIDHKDNWRCEGVPEELKMSNSKPNLQFFAQEEIQWVQLKLKQPEKNQPDSIFESCSKSMVIKIGRAITNDIALNDKACSISSVHACLSWNEEKKGWFISDSNSRNGTYLVIDNSPIKEKDLLAIGLYQCKISKLIFGLAGCSLTLEFTNMADDTIDSFTIKSELKGGDRFMIGKAHQQQFQIDPMTENNQCYLQWDAVKTRLKLYQCPETKYPVGKKIIEGKALLVKNGSLIRFGLLNYYLFDSFTKKNANNSKKPQSNENEEECTICFEKKKSICVLNPCNHTGICMECVLRLCEQPQQNCPFCNCLFEDFIEKNIH